MNETLLPQMNAVLKVVSNYAFSLLEGYGTWIIGLILFLVYIMGSKGKIFRTGKETVYAAMDIKRANVLLKTSVSRTAPSAVLSAASF